MSLGFQFPSCGEKQRLSKVFLMSNTSHWECHNCQTEIRPEKLSTITVALGAFSSAVPAMIALHIYEKPIGFSLGIRLLTGVITYLGTIVYYYKITRLIRS